MSMPPPDRPVPPSGPPPFGAPAPAPVAKPNPSLNGLFAKLQADTSGFLSLLVVLAVGVALAYILWTPFAEPAKLINDAVGDKNCANEIPGTNAMRTCAVKVAGYKMIGPLCVGVVVFVLRRRLARLVSKVNAKLHPGARPLVAPVLATLLFLLVWAGSHTLTGGQTGILPQKAVPALVGVYTFVVVRYAPALQRKLAKWFTTRERIPIIVRVLITVAVPTGISLLITNQVRVTKTAQKEQFVLLIGLVLAYLMMWPKSGDIASAAPKAIAVNPPPPGPAA